MCNKFTNLIIIEFFYQFEFHRRQWNLLLWLKLLLLWIPSSKLFLLITLRNITVTEVELSAQSVQNNRENIFYTYLPLVKRFSSPHCILWAFSMPKSPVHNNVGFYQLLCLTDSCYYCVSLSRWVISDTVFKNLRGIFFLFCLLYVACPDVKE